MNTERLLEERGKTHGDFSHHAGCTQELKRVIQKWGEIVGKGPNLEALSDTQIESLDMITHKIGRIIAGNSNEPDHWKDIAGYATLVVQRLPPT